MLVLLPFLSIIIFFPAFAFADSFYSIDKFAICEGKALYFSQEGRRAGRQGSKQERKKNPYPFMCLYEFIVIEKERDGERQTRRSEFNISIKLCCNVIGSKTKLVNG